jgi:DNA-binding PadR family transcriptional regulator
LKKKASPEKIDLLGPIEYLVLDAVIGLGDDAYGLSVFDLVRERYHQITPGSVYTALERMTWKGYLSGEVVQAKEGKTGRPRKYYHATGLGRRVLATTRKVLFHTGKVVPVPAADHPQI